MVPTRQHKLAVLEIMTGPCAFKKDRLGVSVPFADKRANKVSGGELLLLAAITGS
jgi:hypothetical protein